MKSKDMSKPRILVVEDDGVVARDIQNSLKNMGFEVCAIVPSGQKALQKAREDSPDLVLMDIKLKGDMNGTEAAGQIRAQFDIPVVYLTAYADEDILDRAKITEPFGYIVKPFEDRELNAVVKMALYKRKMENRLKESEQWLFTTLKSIGDAVIATDKAGHVTFINPVAESLTGWQQEEAMGKPLQDVFNIINEETREDVENPVEKVLRKNMIVGLANHTLLIAKDGTEIFVDDSGAPIRDEEGKITGVVLVFRDIRGKREAEKALRESSEELEERVKELNCFYGISRLLENPDISLDEIMQGVVNLIRHSWQYPEITCSRIIVGDEEFKTEDYRETKWKQSSEIFANGTRMGVLEICYLDDKPEIDEGPFLKEERDLISAVTKRLGRVIERMWAREKQEQLETELEEARKMEAIGTLTGGIAHDYNNLMSIVVGNLSMAMEEAEPGSILANFLNEAETASHKVRNLTHELMALSRGGTPVKEVGSLKELLQNASNVIPADGSISLKESISQDLWQLPHDPLKIGAVFRNVMTNAMEAMPGGGTLEIKAENLCLSHGDTNPNLPLKPGDYVHVSIQDQGKGIPKEYLSKIFDPYFSTKAMGTQKGMGLGLATAYAIVQKHGGHIAITSSPGAGTTVNIYLPAESQPEEIHGTTTSADDKASPVKRVLVMDDEEMLRKLARQMLERMGYAVETVKDGVEAIAAYKSQKDSGEPFDAAILDLTIKGGMGGEQAMRELLKIDPGIKAIVSSGYFNDPVMSDFQKYGFKGAMPKPYEKSTLKKVLEKLSE
jgi:PAS domain S-box-containing protein